MEAVTASGTVVCQRCENSFQVAPGTQATQLQYASKDGTRLVRHQICHGCYSYYLNKPTVRVQQGGECSKQFQQIHVLSDTDFDLSELQKVADDRVVAVASAE
jgi:hypothetical protein